MFYILSFTCNIVITIAAASVAVCCHSVAAVNLANVVAAITVVVGAVTANIVTNVVATVATVVAAIFAVVHVVAIVVALAVALLSLQRLFLWQSHCNRYCNICSSSYKICCTYYGCNSNNFCLCNGFCSNRTQ